MNTNTSASAPVRIIGKAAQAFRTTQPDHREPVDVELLRHGPALRAGETPVDTEWEFRIRLADTTISRRGDSTWAAFLDARRDLEQHHGLHVAVAGARRDHAVLNPDRHRESTTVRLLTDTGETQVLGLLEDADPSTIGDVAEQELRRTEWIARRIENRTNRGTR